MIHGIRINENEKEYGFGLSNSTEYSLMCEEEVDKQINNYTLNELRCEYQLAWK
jgi:hypothetical protein